MTGEPWTDDHVQLIGPALHELHGQLLLRVARERVRFFAGVARKIDDPAIERRLVAAYDALIEREAP